jgi:hypothetical protein
MGERIWDDTKFDVHTVQQLHIYSQLPCTKDGNDLDKNHEATDNTGE